MEKWQQKKKSLDGMKKEKLRDAPSEQVMWLQSQLNHLPLNQQ